VKFVSVGNVVADLLMDLPELPTAGDDVTATTSGVSAGGSFNTLVAAVRQGVPAVYGGAHGTGPFGDVVRAALWAEGISVLQTAIPDIDTGWDVAITDATAQRTFLTTVGAEARLDGKALSRIDLSAGDVLHVSGYSFARSPSAEALAAWLPTVPDAVLVVVDPGPLGDAVPEAVRSRADWWSSADGEAGGSPRRGSVLRQGADGCLLNGDRVPGFVVEAIDTNGAGDAHVGVFAASIALGIDPHTAAVRANAAAAMAITRRGPATAPTAGELDAFIAEHPAT
jgi:sugar/nucleoside kinase (ribokinase family)